MQAITMIGTLLLPAVIAVLLVDAYTFRDYVRGHNTFSQVGRS